MRGGPGEKSMYFSSGPFFNQQNHKYSGDIFSILCYNRYYQFTGINGAHQCRGRTGQPPNTGMRRNTVSVQEIFEILGIEPTRDEESIRAAYRSRLTSVNPEDDQQGFMRLRGAYEEAVKYAGTPEGEDVNSALLMEELGPEGEFLRRLAVSRDGLTRRSGADCCGSRCSRPWTEESRPSGGCSHFWRSISGFREEYGKYWERLSGLRRTRRSLRSVCRNPLWSIC